MSIKQQSTTKLLVCDFLFVNLFCFASPDFAMGVDCIRKVAL